MRDFILTIAALGCFLFASCGDYNKVDKTPDYTYKYEAAKQYFAQGYYNRFCAVLTTKLFLYSKALKPVRSLFSFWVWRI